jgi:hypothetical protein
LNKSGNISKNDIAAFCVFVTGGVKGYAAPP